MAGVASNRVNFTVLPPSTPISHVQQASNSDITGSTYSSFSATFPSATASGNAIILGVTYGNADVTITGTDSHGNSYAQAIKTYDPGHHQGCAILYSTNIAGGAAPTVTVNFSAPVAYLALGVHEYTAISVLDVTSGNMGSGVSPSSGSATTTANGDLIFGCAAEDTIGHGDTYTAGTGFTKRVDLGNAAAYADEDEILPLARPAAITWSLSPAGLDRIADMAAFKPQSNSAPNITSLSPVSGVVGTAVTIAGAHLGPAQGNSTVAFNGATAAVTGWSDTQIGATVPNAATTGPVSVIVGRIASNGVNFTVIVPPVITSVSPNSGVAGTQVAISGSGFGATQASGVVWLGSRYGTVVSWSNSQIVATVAAGSLSGVAQVRQGGAASNSLPFTVNTATIASVTPTSASPGAQVTIAGSGFGSAQGSGQVWLGTAPGQVISWSDAQVVATVSTGSNSGNAQILQTGVWSNAVPFTVTGTPPHITSINPNRGGSGTVVTIQGTGFGSSQGSGAVWIGAAYASVNSWSDTHVSATVASNAVSGIAKIQQNGVWSNAATFTVPSSAAITLNPSVISMLVGDTRSIQALNSQGHPVTGLTWSSSDHTIVALSTDDPPILTAVAPGNVTITAGGASADVTVYSGGALPVGTVLWSNPGDGSGVGAIYPAVPSYTGVADVFLQNLDGTLQAITGDGSVAWTATLPNDLAYYFSVPDFQGGFVVYSSNSTYISPSIYKLDGLTGQSNPAYTPTPSQSAYPFDHPLAVHTDGTIFAMEHTCSTPYCDPSPDPPTRTWVVGIDPSTGTAKFKIPTANSVDQGTVTENSADATVYGPFCGAPNGSHIDYLPPEYSPTPYIAGDGHTYLGYMTFEDPGTTTETVPQPWPIAAYQSFDLLVQDTLNSNFTAAISDLEALWQAMGQSPNPGDHPNDPLFDALQNHDRKTAQAIESGMAGQFTHLCDISFTITQKLHILRVGTDGSSSDVIVHQWTSSNSAVYTATSDHLYHFTRTQSAPEVDPWTGYPITNADQGALFSGSVVYHKYCTVETDGICVGANIPTIYEYHLTTAGSGGVSDRTWNEALPLQQGQPVQPTLQLEDGSFVGHVFDVNAMVAFDASGNVKWTVPGYYPQMATADGNVIALAIPQGLVACSVNSCSAVIFDANGNATGQLANLPQFPSWLGNGYNYGSLEQVAFPSLALAGTFAALANGNASQNGTAIKQVLTNDVQGVERQLPELGGGPTLGNINMVEFRTDKSPDFIFQTYLETYAPVLRNPGDAQPFRNTVMFFTNSPVNPDYTNPDTINVTGPNQVLTIALRGVIRLGQGPFSVGTERFDPVNHVISAVTLKGHPLAGWRYWRVYSVGTNDVIIETGAYDAPGPNTKNFVGYFLGQGTVSKSWREFMEYIRRQRDLNASPGSYPMIDVGGQGQLVPAQTLLNGLWDRTGFYRDYILNNVCQAPPGAASCN